MANRPIVHLFCNAHIDPIWMWAWEEGARETISTFTTAANLLGEFPEFIFNHNESMLYEWIEEYDPALFERIKRLVQEGRWNITGGWYLQPDCNLPGGETLVRVILEGRRYFKEKFNVRPTVAYNFDTFGHPGSLPQLLRQSGFELYVHHRPVAEQMELPSPLYCWQGMDGTEILSIRPDSGWYGTPHKEQAEAQARKGVEIARATGRDVLVTWGLGDHGGGATRYHLNRMREVITEFARSDVEVRHSTPEAYLARIKALDVPTKVGELQRAFAGCYTSTAPIKRQMRQGEALLASAERWAAIAWWRYGSPYPAERLREAWKRLMFNTFHDVLCGSLIESAIPGVLEMYGFARDVARRVIVRSQHALLPNVPATPGTIPLYVLNPHAHTMRAPLGLNFLSEYAPPLKLDPFALFDDSGLEIVCQKSGGPTPQLDGTWQPFIGFVAEMPPLAARRYEIRYQLPTVSPTNTLRVNENDAEITLENGWWRARFSREQAALVELVDLQAGRNVINAPIQLFAMRDVSHAWGGENRVIFNEPVSVLKALSAEEVGAFVGMEGSTGPALRVIAEGPVSITVEALVGWQHTRASIKVIFYADLPYIDIDVRLYMQARRKMIKLVLPFNLMNVRTTCEVPYGTAERPADATEWPYSRWLRLETAEFAIGVANDGQSGFDVSADGNLSLSISRGATHTAWSETDVPPHKPYTYMDQEQIDTKFRLLTGKPGSVTTNLISAALELNQPLERFFVYHPPTAQGNAPTQSVPFLIIEPETIVLGAMKKSETEDALIVRLVETIGQNVIAQIRFEERAMPPMIFRPYEIKSFKIVHGSEHWETCNLIEESL